MKVLLLALIALYSNSSFASWVEIPEDKVRDYRHAVTEVVSQATASCQVKVGEPSESWRLWDVYQLILMDIPRAEINDEGQPLLRFVFQHGQYPSPQRVITVTHTTDASFEKVTSVEVRQVDTWVEKTTVSSGNLKEPKREEVLITHTEVYAFICDLSY